MAERAVGELVAGRYEIRGVVGPRPLGTLYRAIDRDIGVEVALRVLSPGLLPDEATRQAFVQKIARGKSLSHAHLVRLYDVRTEADEVVLAVQWAPGTPLAEKVRSGRLSHADARRIVAQVAAAMTHAHGHGIVLADVRTENIVVAPTESGDALKLSSVGIGPALPRARFLDALRGTLAFERLAPEIRNGLAAEVRADVYSLAVLAVELTTGTPPTRPLSIVGAASALVHVLSRALADDPMLRQVSVEALHHELDAVLATGELPPRPRRLSPPPKSDFNAEDNPDQTRETPMLDPADVGYTDETRQVDEQELDRLRGREVTRQASPDEIWDLRVKSQDTQQTEMDLEAVRQADGTWRSPIPKDPFEIKTDEVKALPQSDPTDQTIEVPRLEPEMPPPPPAQPVSAAPPPVLPRSAADVDDGTPLPPPAPAPPMMGGGPEDFGDDQMATNRIDKVSLADLQLPVPTPAARAGSSEPKIVSELPSEPGPSRTATPTGQRRAPPPAPRRGPPSAPSPAQPPPAQPRRSSAVPPLAPPPPARHEPSGSGPLPLPPPPEGPPPRRQPQRTMQVDPMPPPRRGGNLAGIALIVIALGVVGAIVLGVLSHMRDLKRQRDRIEKQRLAGELNARADAMRRGETAARTDLLAPQPSDAGTAVAPSGPIVTRPEVAPLAQSGPCPLGAKLVDGKPRFCVDLYEYPGGKTIPRTGVSFDEATRLCASRGERLCGENEWERACRGKGSTSFPYGSNFDPNRCNTRGVGEVSAAGSFKDCRSGSGAYDMSGNVAEWTIGRDGKPATKGGSIQTTGRDARCSHTVRGVARDGDILVGFRCCADPK